GEAQVHQAGASRRPAHSLNLPDVLPVPVGEAATPADCPIDVERPAAPAALAQVIEAVGAGHLRAAGRRNRREKERAEEEDSSQDSNCAHVIFLTFLISDDRDARDRWPPARSGTVWGQEPTRRSTKDRPRLVARPSAHRRNARADDACWPI